MKDPALVNMSAVFYSFLLASTPFAFSSPTLYFIRKKQNVKRKKQCSGFSMHCFVIEFIMLIYFNRHFEILL